MDKEQNTDGKIPDVSENELDKLQDNYYSVDDPKKEAITTIGDGEMHNEGLAGVDDVTEVSQSSEDRLSDEQGVAENHDSEQ